jgi:hypothetical protein
MKLEEFISNTLISITNGIQSANKITNVGESKVLFVMEPSREYKDRSDGCIKFDVAVTTSKADSSKGGGQIIIWSVGIGGEKKSDISDQIVSRIKFNITPDSTVA